MKKGNIAVYLGVLLITFMIVFGTYQIQNFLGKSKEDPQQLSGDYAMKAVYLADESGNSIFVDLTTQTPFYGTLPDEITDEDGEALSQEELASGDVFHIWGNGVVAQSYPAQYHGIEKMERIEQANQEYIKQYGGFLAEFFPEEDLSQLPYLNLTYSQTDAMITAAVDSTGSYQWTYADEAGKEVTKEEEKGDIASWENIADITIEGSLSAQLVFSTEPVEVTVMKYQEGKEKEQAAVSVSEEGNYQLELEPESCYRITASWENGYVEYGFQTVSAK